MPPGNCDRLKWLTAGDVAVPAQWRLILYGEISDTRQGSPGMAQKVEDVPAFVELESGGPSPGACRVVGHG
jgi:hypothetical protein